MTSVASREHKIVASHLRDLMATYKQNEDLIAVGAYARGSNIKIDKAIAINQDITNLLRQDISEYQAMDVLFDQMVEIARKAEREVDPGFQNENR
jgi:flagellum-specific ATP synthase